MCTKVKQLGANICKQVAIVLKLFLDCFKLFKTHNMVALMLDPHFKDLSLVGLYIDHSFAIEIVAKHMIVDYSSQPSRPRTKSCMNNQMFRQTLYKKLCTILMLVLEWECSRMRLVLNKCCFLNLFERHVNQIIFLFAHFKLTYLGILCKFDEGNHVFAHLMCHWKKQKTFFFGGQNTKGNDDNCLFN